MTLPLDPDLDPLALADAVGRFVHALRGRADLGRAARLEAVFAAPGPAVFGLDQALARLWPQELAALPAHEVIWARRQGGAPRLTLAAYDASGRLILRQRLDGLAAGGAEHG